MMNYNKFLNEIANKFESYAKNIPENINLLETEDFGWSNIRYESEIFRLAHIERYSDDKIEVLHFTTFPHKWSPEPIFGFDVICTDNKVVGAYMDMSPVLKTYPFDDGIDFQERKPLPEWATVFSDRFILLSPKSDEEFVKFVNWCLQKYVWYLAILLRKETDNQDLIIKNQNRYCEVQSSNPRTFNVLKTKIGKDRASYFMQTILFPKISS